MSRRLGTIRPACNRASHALTKPNPAINTNAPAPKSAPHSPCRLLPARPTDQPNRANQQPQPPIKRPRLRTRHFALPNFPREIPAPAADKFTQRQPDRHRAHDNAGEQTDGQRLRRDMKSQRRRADCVAPDCRQSMQHCPGVGHAAQRADDATQQRQRHAFTEQKPADLFGRKPSASNVPISAVRCSSPN